MRTGSAGCPRNHGNCQHPGEARAPGEWPAQCPSFSFGIRTDSLAPKGAWAVGYDNVQARVQGPSATHREELPSPTKRCRAGGTECRRGQPGAPPPPSVSPRPRLGRRPPSSPRMPCRRAVPAPGTCALPAKTSWNGDSFRSTERRADTRCSGLSGTERRGGPWPLNGGRSRTDNQNGKLVSCWPGMAVRGQSPPGSGRDGQKRTLWVEIRFFVCVWL